MRGKNVREKYNEDTAGERILKKKMIKRTVELPREKQAEFPFMKSLVINLPFFPGSSKRQKRQQMWEWDDPGFKSYSLFAGLLWFVHLPFC